MPAAPAKPAPPTPQRQQRDEEEVTDIERLDELRDPHAVAPQTVIVPIGDAPGGKAVIAIKNQHLQLRWVGRGFQATQRTYVTIRTLACPIGYQALLRKGTR